MLKVSGEDTIRTNHIMVMDNKERIYCRLANNVIKWNSAWYQENCSHCQFLNGLGQDIGVIECAFDDGTDNISETVEEPFTFMAIKQKLGFKKV